MNNSPSILEPYLKASQGHYNSSTLAYIAILDHLVKTDPSTAVSIMQELQDQRNGLKLIASENYCSYAVQLAMSNWLTDKYAEGFPNRRFYAGCENVDDIESIAAERACELFGAEHAFVQPHCGADANLLAFMATIFERIQLPWLQEKQHKGVDTLTAEEFEELRRACMNQKVLGMSLNSGGHLTHGYRMNLSARLLQAFHYDVDKKTGLLDYANVRDLALKHRPLILLAGYSAYPRRINFAKMREIAEESGSVLIADMAHFAGLVAGGVFTGDENPVTYAHIVTTTTHKTLRGPRGGLVLCKKEFANAVNKACPLMMGGPLSHVTAAKAIAFKEALQPSFKDYAAKICTNAKALANGLLKRSLTLVTGGTDNHLMIINVQALGLTGKQAELALRSVGITVNRNSIPFDTQGPWLTSGVRIGTAAVTTLGMGVEEMDIVAELIEKTLRHTKPDSQDAGLATLDESIHREITQQLKSLKDRFSLYPEIPNLDLWIAQYRSKQK